MKESEPTRCPFCGGSDVGWLWKIRDLGSPLRFFCFCWECRSNGPEGATPYEAIRLWNKRGEITNGQTYRGAMGTGAR